MILFVSGFNVASMKIMHALSYVNVLFIIHNTAFNNSPRISKPSCKNVTGRKCFVSPL